MSKHLARDLEALQRSLLGMAGRVEEAIYSAAQALRDRDVALAKRVIAGDEAIDQLENELYEDCL
jgi:phosphate transport system protein